MDNRTARKHLIVLDGRADEEEVPILSSYTFYHQSINQQAIEFTGNIILRRLQREFGYNCSLSNKKQLTVNLETPEDLVMPKLF